MLDAKIQMLSPKANGLLIITRSTDVTISALFFLFLIYNYYVTSYRPDCQPSDQNILLEPS